MTVLKNTLLTIGAVLIIVTGVFALQNLTDRVVFTVLVPGFVFGLLLIGVAMVLRRGA